MSTLSRRDLPTRESGYSLIELMIAILIALFLIGGIIVVEQGVHRAYGDQSGISKLQDEERFAMSILTDVVSSAGYFPDPTTTSVVTALPSTGSPLSLAAGQTLFGTAGPPDSIYVRFMTASGDGIDLCDGTTNTSGGNISYTSNIYVLNNQLYCNVQPGSGSWNGAIQLVNDVTNMQVWYGINSSGTDNNVDTYIPAASMTAANWPAVTSVMIELTFKNPLYGSPGETAVADQTVTFRRVINVMGRN
jgi:type IV pilus assembly protein PilW